MKKKLRSEENLVLVRTSDSEEDNRGRCQSHSEARTCATVGHSRAKKKSSTLIASDRNGDKGESDKNTKTSNKNLAQGNKSTP